MKGFIIGVVVILLIVFGFVHALLHGIMISTGQGQHTGYATAIEQDGWFWHPTTVYVKTDTQSSQEDTYCVTDPAVVATLTKDVDSKAHIILKYRDYVVTGIENCGSPNEVVYEVDPADD